MQYEIEAMRTLKYVFTNDAYPKAELSFWVEQDNTQQDDELENRAYYLLQDVHPTTWHDWRLLESYEV
jgi:Lon protease-like protein